MSPPSMSVTRGILRFSPILRSGVGGGHAHYSGGSGTAATRRRHWYDFGNPWRDDYPAWIWRSLRYSRKDKDIFAPLARALNSTRVYEIFLKDHRRYWVFVMGMGMTISWMWSEMWIAIWRKINKGKLYNDVPYVYPAED